MTAANIERVKRRMLQDAVAENIDAIRGLPPRGVRPVTRAMRIWMRRAPFFLVPLALAGSTYLVSQEKPNLGQVAVVRAGVPGASSRPLLAKPEGRLEAGSTPDSLERVNAAAFPLAIRRVVLDAGHGGSDPGATRDKVIEKEITLDIGRRLRTLLEGDGFEVVATRDNDRTIALRERARQANDSKSDIFVSIHVNAIIKHTASRGIETYYLGPTDDPSLTKLVAAENRESGYSMADMRKLLDSVYADARRAESHELATLVQKQLYTTLRESDPGLENWGVKRAPFVVLVATDMPSILAEVGCVSNDKEAAMLARAEYRQKIAQALFQGIRAYAGANDAPHKVEKGS